MFKLELNTTEKFILRLTLLGFAFNFIYLFYQQTNLEQIEVYKAYGPLTVTNFIGDVFLSIASLLSFYHFQRFFNPIYGFTYIVLLIFSFFNTYEIFDKLAQQPTLFYSFRSPGPFINMGILFFTARKNPVNIVMHFVFIGSIIVLLTAFVAVLTTSIGDRSQGLLAAREYAIVCFWVCSYFLVSNFEKGIAAVYALLLLLMIAFIILAIASRSYLMLIVLIICIKINNILKTIAPSKKVITITGISVVLCIGLFIFINSEYFIILESLSDILFERIDEDTRSDQLTEFLAQFKLDDLYTGVGPLKKWNWSGSNEYYEFVDNQLLYLCWWAGLPFTVIYFGFIASPIKNFFNKNKSKLENLYILFYFMAFLGFAIYIGIGCTVNNAFLYLLIGFSIQRNNISLIHYKSSFKTKYENFINS